MTTTSPPPQRELVRLERTRGRVLRLADRYAATGRTELSTRIRHRAEQIRFASADVAEQAEHTLLNELASIPDSLASDAQRAFAGTHDGLDYVRIDDTLRLYGSRAWRTNNPGGISFSELARQHQAIGADRTWAIFPNAEAGREALSAYLDREAETSASVAEIVAVLTDEQAARDPLSDLQLLFQAFAIHPDTRLRTLSPIQVRALATIICMWALSQRGHVYAADKDAPAWVTKILRASDAHQPGTSAKTPARSIVPATTYLPSDDLCVITTFFNPCGYWSRRRNFDRFVRPLAESRVGWWCIECAFGEQQFALPEAPNIFQVRANSILWQKERLLNMLIHRLPDRYDKVAWIDADVLFSNPNWLTATSNALDDQPVVQPYTEAIRLPQGADAYIGSGTRTLSFAYRYHLEPASGAAHTYQDHGHTGFAWAARRDWLETHGLYDSCLSGTGDHLIAHALVGDWEQTCGGLLDSAFTRHFAEWAAALYPKIRSRLGYVDGHILSLWHGDAAERNYYHATLELNEQGFNPNRDLRRGTNGCLEWAAASHTLRQWSYAYFVDRREDEPPERMTHNNEPGESASTAQMAELLSPALHKSARSRPEFQQ